MAIELQDKMSGSAFRTEVQKGLDKTGDAMEGALYTRKLDHYSEYDIDEIVPYGVITSAIPSFALWVLEEYDAGFGKGFDDVLTGLGMQMCIYAAYHGENFYLMVGELGICNNMQQIKDNEFAIADIKSSQSLLELVKNSTYASTVLAEVLEGYI